MDPVEAAARSLSRDTALIEQIRRVLPQLRALAAEDGDLTSYIPQKRATDEELIEALDHIISKFPDPLPFEAAGISISHGELFGLGQFGQDLEAVKRLRLAVQVHKGMLAGLPTRKRHKRALPSLARYAAWWRQKFAPLASDKDLHNFMGMVGEQIGLFLSEDAYRHALSEAEKSPDEWIHLFP
jgi:hypothetical protein